MTRSKACGSTSPSRSAQCATSCSSRGMLCASTEMISCGTSTSSTTLSSVELSPGWLEQRLTSEPRPSGRWITE